MKVPLGHLDWGLGTKDPLSDPADPDLDLCIVSNVSKRSNFENDVKTFMSLAPVLYIDGFQYLHMSSSCTCDSDVINNFCRRKIQSGRRDRHFS